MCCTYIHMSSFFSVYLQVQLQLVKSLSLTLCDPMDCSLPSSSVHGIFQAIVLEGIAISFFRGSSQTRDWTLVSRIVDKHFTIWATREVSPCTQIIKLIAKYMKTPAWSYQQIRYKAEIRTEPFWLMKPSFPSLIHFSLHTNILFLKNSVDS